MTHSDRRKPSACWGCPHTENLVNGLFCDTMSRYVEHVDTQPCTQPLATAVVRFRSQGQGSEPVQTDNLPEYPEQ